MIRLIYNGQGKIVLDNGKNLPKVKYFYDEYVLNKKPINKIAFNTLLKTWNVFGNKFKWGSSVYRCQVV